MSPPPDCSFTMCWAIFLSYPPFWGGDRRGLQHLGGRALPPSRYGDWLPQRYRLFVFAGIGIASRLTGTTQHRLRCLKLLPMLT